jgi:hypothetical protein
MKYVTIALLASVLIFLATYWAGNGFSASDGVFSSAEGFYIHIDQPSSGSSYSQANTFVLRGGSLGGTLQRVVVWDQAYNVGIPCNVLGTTFSLEIDAERLSTGSHTLVVQAQATDGRWSDCASVDVMIVTYYGEGIVALETESDPLDSLFQPMYDIINGISMGFEEGIGDNDLNGDNIDDRLQSSPVSPRYNALNLPLTIILIVVIVCLILFLVIYYFFRYRSVESLHHLQLTRHLSETPDKRRWYLKLQELKPKQVSKQLGKLRRLEKDITDKSKRMKVREAELVAKQIHLKKQEQSTVTLGRLISTAVKKKTDRINMQQRKLLEQQEFFKKQSALQEQLLQAKHSLSVDQLQQEKNALQQRIYEAKQQNASERALRNLSSKISSVEGRISFMKDDYEKKLLEERKAREYQRKRFGHVLAQLRKEKEDLSRQKSVKIFIGAKKKDGEHRPVNRALHSTPPHRPVHHPTQSRRVTFNPNGEEFQ